MLKKTPISSKQRVAFRIQRVAFKPTRWQKLYSYWLAQQRVAFRKQRVVAIRNDPFGLLYTCVLSNQSSGESIQFIKTVKNLLFFSLFFRVVTLFNHLYIENLTRFASKRYFKIVFFSSIKAFMHPKYYHVGSKYERKHRGMSMIRLSCGVSVHLFVSISYWPSAKI